jgi:hypothetical protein
MVNVPVVVAEFIFCKKLEKLLEDGGAVEESPLFPLPAVG